MSGFHADENRTRDVSRSAQTEALARPTSSAAQIPFSLATRIDTTHFDNPSAPCMLCVDAPRGIGQSKSHGTGKKSSCAHVICRAKKDKKNRRLLVSRVCSRTLITSVSRQPSKMQVPRTCTLRSKFLRGDGVQAPSTPTAPSRLPGR